MFSNILSNFGARLIAAIIGFGVLLLTTHFLGGEVRGEISLIQLAVSIVHLISDIAGGPGMVYLVPRASKKTLLLAGYVWAAVCAWGFGWLVVHFGHIPAQYELAVIGLSFLVSALSVHYNILIGKEKIRLYSMLIVLNALLLISAMAAFMYFSPGVSVMPYLVGAYTGNAIAFLVSLWLVLKQPEGKELERGRTIFLLFRNGFFNQLASLTHQLGLRVNFYYLTSAAAVAVLLRLNMTSEKAVGIYSTTLALAEAILLFSLSVSTVLQSRVANLASKAEARRMAFLLAKMSVVMTLPALLLFAVLPPQFYSGLLGKDFSPVHEVFVWLTPGALLVSFGSVFSHYFAGCGKHYLNAISGLIAIIVTLLTAPLLIPKYGLEGAGLCASCAYGSIAIFIFTAFLFEKERTPGDWKFLLPSVNDWNLLRTQLNKLTKR